MAVFWVVGPCSLVEVYRRFRGALMMEAGSISETLVNFYQTTQCATTQKTAIFIPAAVRTCRIPAVCFIY
jgi:hypothetical protein